MLFSNPSWKRLLLWFSGIMPLLLVIDGTLSNLRTYEEQDYFDIIHSIPGHETMEWKYETYPTLDLKSGALGDYRIFRFLSPLFEQLMLFRILTAIPKTEQWLEE
jgi:hypothetical protein